MKLLKKISLFVFITIVVINLSSCSTLGQKIWGLKKVTTTIQTGPALNPNYKGRSSPVVLTIYQLTNSQSFVSADYFSLQDSAKNALGDSLITMQQIELLPNSTRTLQIPINKKTKFIGIVAGFSRLANSQWRQIISKEKIKSAKIKLYINENIIQIKG